MGKHEVLVEENKDLAEKHEVQVKENKDLAEKHEVLAGKYKDLIQQLRDKVECPVCLNVPKKAPIPVCPNGHVVCSKCLMEECPTCRVKMEQGKSSLAVTVMENIDHECENEGCKEKLSHGKLVSHGKSCVYRPVECPDLGSCKDKISLASLPTHLVSCCLSESKIESYKMPRVVRYNTPLAWETGNRKQGSTWKLVSMKFDEHIFLLKVAARFKIFDGGHRWFFMVQMLGGEEETSKYGATIIVHRMGDDPEGKFSSRYSGDICTIDITKEQDADKKGLCLTLTNGVMKRFLVDVDPRDAASIKSFSVSVDLYKQTQ